MRPEGLVQGIHIRQCDTLMNGQQFTNPFRYIPHPLVREAACEVIRRIEASPELAEAFAEGKMLGVLVCEAPACHSGQKSGTTFLAAFSGNVGGQSRIDGFVPPIFDLLDPAGHFKIKEAEITVLNRQIHEMEHSPSIEALKKELIDAQNNMHAETERMRAAMAAGKKERDKARRTTTDGSLLAELTRQSQYEKAEFRRLKARWEDKTGMIRNRLEMALSDIDSLKKLRAEKSDSLQKWIFGEYIVQNAIGERRSIWDIFAGKGLIPPGGTGECAAPKLLNHAYKHGLKPIAMGEFWYGRSPETAVRTHGRFYPSCTSKCGPLLEFMTKGLTLTGPPSVSRLEEDIIYEDSCMIAVDKPSGVPSVPGLDGQTSIQERLSLKHGECIAVHRLDMDTSGVLLFAKTRDAAVILQRQFEERSVRKTYMARLAPASEGKQFKNGDKGMISLPLCPDHDERPRQKADRIQGKEAVTEYEVVSTNEDGTTDMIFHPVTGRTHQLRVHAAHHLGLGRPILGDLLYGGFAPATSASPYPDPERLHLHACSITFNHPISGEQLTLTSRK